MGLHPLAAQPLPLISLPFRSRGWSLTSPTFFLSPEGHPHSQARQAAQAALPRLLCGLWEARRTHKSQVASGQGLL